MKAFGIKTILTIATGLIVGLAIVKLARDADIPVIEDLLPSGLF